MNEQALRALCYVGSLIVVGLFAYRQGRKDEEKSWQLRVLGWLQRGRLK